MVGSCISDYNPQVGSTQQSNPTAGCRQEQDCEPSKQKIFNLTIKTIKKFLMH